MKTLFFAFIFLISFKLVLVSCTKDKVIIPVETPFLTAECPDTVKYSVSIEPLIAANCSTSGCHDATNAGGYKLTNYTEIQNNASAILTSITLSSNNPLAMPYLAPSLSATDIQNVKCWINQGKLNN